MNIKISSGGSIWWDNGGNAHATFGSFNGIGGGGWEPILRLPCWEPVAAAILPQLPLECGIENGMKSLVSLRDVLFEVDSYLRELADERSQKYYEICGLGDASIDVVRAIMADHRTGSYTRCAKKQISLRRRSQFNRERDVLALKLIDAGAPYICAAPGCDVHTELTIDHIVALSRGGADDIDNLRFLCQPHNSEKGDRDAT